MATLTYPITGTGTVGGYTSTVQINVTYTYSVSNSNTGTTVQASSIKSSDFLWVRHGSAASDNRAKSMALSNLSNTVYKLNFGGTQVTQQSGISSVNKTISKSGSATLARTHVNQSKLLYFNSSDYSTYITVPALASYTVSYNANGGSGAPGNQTKWYGETLTLSATRPTREGYAFDGWNTKADGSGTNYNPSGSYTANAAVTLYAKWKPRNMVIYYDSNGVKHTGIVYIYDENGVRKNCIISIYDSNGNKRQIG